VDGFISRVSTLSLHHIGWISRILSVNCRWMAHDFPYISYIDAYYLQCFRLSMKLEHNKKRFILSCCQFSFSLFRACPHLCFGQHNQSFFSKLLGAVNSWPILWFIDWLCSVRLFSVWSSINHSHLPRVLLYPIMSMLLIWLSFFGICLWVI